MVTHLKLTLHQVTRMSIMTNIKMIRNTIASLLILIGSTSCENMVTLSKSDSRFAPILGKEVYVKKPIYLYEIDPGLNSDSSRFPVSSAKYDPRDVVGILGIGHPVVFEAVKTTRGFNAYSQALVGYTDFKSKRFPITWGMSYGGDEWKIGFANYFVSPLFTTE